LEDFLDRLPVYEAQLSKDFPEFLIVWCPREKCLSHQRERPFLVHKNTWMFRTKLTAVRTGREYVIRTRACPYCMLTSRLPERREIR
jgi:hypothetical protein